MKKVSFFVIVVSGNCVSLTGRPISNANSTFIGTLQCSIFHVFLPLTFTIENDLLPLHIIVDRNQVFILFTETIWYSQVQNISKKKDCRSVNIKSKNGKMLDAGCNNILTVPLVTGKKYYLF